MLRFSAGNIQKEVIIISYNRTNRIILTDSGYSHDQDNKKMITENGMQKLQVEEKGMNSYKKLDKKHCATAKIWWEKNKKASACCGCLFYFGVLLILVAY